MLISGLVKSSLIDYPEKIAAVIFTNGCNFRCPYCHNPDVVLGKGTIDEEEVFEFLKSRKGKLDAVTVSGGEPTLQKDLILFLEKIRELGFLIKLDTNGSRPEIIKEIAAKGLVDYIAMDIKGPLEKYPKITSSSVNPEKIKETAEFLHASKIEFEYRTTVVRGLLQESDFYKIRNEFQKFGPPKKYFLQNFRPDVTLEEGFQKTEPYSAEEMQKFKEIFEGFCFCFIR